MMLPMRKNRGVMPRSRRTVDFDSLLGRRMLFRNTFDVEITLLVRRLKTLIN
jgi:hypothetical protein